MEIKKSDIFRLACIILLWLALCYLVASSQPFSLRVLFVMIASGIIIFVPIVKKYKKSCKK